MRRFLICWAGSVAVLAAMAAFIVLFGFALHLVGWWAIAGALLLLSLFAAWMLSSPNI